MAKRIVNKAERNAERYDAKETGYRLFEDSQNGKTFDRLMPLIVSEQNIILAYRNICNLACSLIKKATQDNGDAV